MGYDATFEILPASGMLDLRGNSAVRQICETALGMRLPETANRIIAGPGDLLAYCISPDHWLLQLDDGQQRDILDSLEQAAAANRSHSFVDVSDMYVRIRLSGPEAREVLSQGISIDLHARAFPPGATARTRFAKTTAQLYCVDDAPTYIITVYRSYQQYAVEWLSYALGPG